MNLPNKITLTRIFMIPVFVLFFYLDVLNGWNFLIAAIIFLLAASTDALDGHIARVGDSSLRESASRSSSPESLSSAVSA